MNLSTPGLPVHHQLPEFTQTHVHRVSDAIQPSHPLSSPFPPAPNPSQHQSLFQWGSQSTWVSAVASFLPKNTQSWSPCSPRDSQESYPTPQFKSINSLALSFLHSPTLASIHDYWKNHSLDYLDLCWQSNVSLFSVLSRSFYLGPLIFYYIFPKCFHMYY